MYKNNKIIGIIPARGGSKGIKNKNLVNLNGKPLIWYTIKEALKSKYLDSIVVSTDSNKISNVALKYNAEVPFLRPIELSQDNSKTIEAIIYTIEKLETLGKHYDYVIILQPTQPLRNSKHIDESIEFTVKNNFESTLSISEVTENPVFMRSIEKKYSLVPILDFNSTIRRQELPKYFKVNGSIYINKINSNLSLKTSLNDNNHGYIMSNKYDLDIDSLEDLEKFNRILKKNKGRST